MQSGYTYYLQQFALLVMKAFLIVRSPKGFHSEFDSIEFLLAAALSNSTSH